MREAMPDANLAASFRVGGAANFTNPAAGNGRFTGTGTFPEQTGPPRMAA